MTLVNRLHQICTALGDNNFDGSSILYDKLVTICVVGGQVRTFTNKMYFFSVTLSSCAVPREQYRHPEKKEALGAFVCIVAAYPRCCNMLLLHKIMFIFD